jgi:TrmH family RNA methyltransferase
MTVPEKIASLQNPRVKALVKLRRRQARDAAGRFLIEEPLVITRALAAGHPLQTVYFCPELLTAAGRALLHRLQSPTGTAPPPATVAVTPPVMRKIAYRAEPAGLLVVAPQQRRSLAELSLGPDPLLVVLENVEKPGNLGAVLRAADGAGAAAVLLCGRGADPFNPNVLRASRGVGFQVPTVAATTADVAAWLAEHGIAAVAAAPTAATVYSDADLRRPLALVLGAEDAGLSAQWLERADRHVRIPMRGSGDSLNVATSAAILLYEAIRQEGASR